MSQPLVCVGVDESAQAVALIMDEGAYGFVGVQDESGALVGVITDRDIATRVCAQGLPADATPVQSVMSAPVVTCARGEPIEAVEELMMRHQIQRVVVHDERGETRGVLSLSDLAQCEQPLRVAQVVRQVTAREFRYKSAHPPETKA